MAIIAPGTNVGIGSSSPSGSEVSFVTPIQSGDPFGGSAVFGAPSTTYVAPSPITLPITLDVVVTDSVRVSNGEETDSGPQIGDYADNTGTGTDWQNPQAVFESDDNYATVELAASAASKYLEVGGFNFNLPEDAELIGIEIEVERSNIRGAVASDELILSTCEFVTPSTVLDYTSDTYWSSTNSTYTAGDWVCDSPPCRPLLAPIGGWMTEGFMTNRWMFVTFTLTTATSTTVDLDHGSGFGFWFGPTLSTGTHVGRLDCNDRFGTDGARIFSQFKVHPYSYTGLTIDKIEFADGELDVTSDFQWTTPS